MAFTATFTNGLPEATFNTMDEAKDHAETVLYRSGVIWNDDSFDGPNGGVAIDGYETAEDMDENAEGYAPHFAIVIIEAL